MIFILKDKWLDWLEYVFILIRNFSKNILMFLTWRNFLIAMNESIAMKSTWNQTESS